MCKMAEENNSNTSRTQSENKMQVPAENINKLKSDNIPERLKYFVESFREEFMEKIKEFEQEAKGKKHKSSKTFDFIGKGVTPVAGKFLGGFIKTIFESVGNEQHKKRATKIFSVLSLDTEQLKNVLTKVGFSIFQSYEYQYMEVDDAGGWKIAMAKLSQDAVDRIMNGIYEYVKKGDDESEESGSNLDPDTMYQNLIIECFLGGKSKGYIGDLLPKQKLCFKNVDCSISSIYENVGLIVLNEDNMIKKYFKIRNKSSDKVVKYGYRLIFDFEKRNKDFFSTLSNKYEEVDISPVFNYSIQKDDFLSLKESLKPKQDETVLKLNKIEDSIESLQKEQERSLVYLQAIKDKNSDNESESQCKQVWYDMNTRQTSLHFTGRELFLEQIDKDICRGFVVISGLSGVGKTETAIKYARTKYTQQDSVIWINAESFNTLKSSFFNLYKRLGFKLKDKEELTSIKIIVEDAFAYFTKGTILFIYDNADSFNDIKDFLPIGLPPNANAPNVLITSTNSEWRTNQLHLTVLTLSDFEDHEADSFIRHYLSIENYDGNEVRNMIKRLNNFPLALKQVAEIIFNEAEALSYINKDSSIVNYFKKFDRKIEDLLQSKSIDFYNENSKTVYTTMTIVVDKIEKKNKIGPLAVNILKIMAYFSPENVSTELFLPITKYDEPSLGMAIKLLKDKSVIKITETLNIHGLMQHVVRLHVQDIKQEEMVLEDALNLLKNHLDNENYTQHSISVWNWAYKHDNLINKFLNKDILLVKKNYHFLHLIAEGCKFYVIYEIFQKIEKNCDVNEFIKILNSKDKYRGTILHRAAVRGDVSLVNFLLSKKAFRNAAKIHKLTPLHLGAKNGRLEAVKALATSKNIHFKTVYHFTSVHLAARSGFSDIVEYLLQRSADVNALTKFHYTPLHLATQREYIDVVKVLLNHKNINVNIATLNLVTPLHLASQRSNLEIVLDLLNKGSEINARTLYNYTALHYSAMNNQTNIVSALIRHKADLNLTTTDGDTPLHFAAKNGNWDVVQELLRNCNNSHILNNEKKTAAEKAFQNNHLELGNFINNFTDPERDIITHENT